MTKDEALKMCLEYIETNAQGSKFAILIKEALAQPEQEPVACDCDSPSWCKQYKKCNRKMLGFMPYVAQPQRTWVGLTKEERHEISMANRPYCADVMAAHEEELKRRNT